MVWLIVAMMLLNTSLSARTFYVSSSYTGSTSNGALSTPWKSLANVQSNMSLIMPGDTVAFKCGDVFTGTLTISRSGTAAAPITFSAYGTGNLPKFTGTGAVIENLIYTYGRSYLTFNRIEISDTSLSPTDRTQPSKIRRAFNFDGPSTNNIIKNCKISLVGVGAYFATGSSYCKIDSCEIFNLRLVVNTPTTVNNNDDYGANPVVISSSNNAVLHSYFHDCWANSYDYGYDGGAVEFYGNNISNNLIAYNTFYDCNGSTEFGSGSGGTITNITFAYNKFINNGKMFYINNSGAYTVAVTDLKYYNNVIIENVVNRLNSSNLGSMSVNLTTPGIVIMKNNIFQLSSGIDVVRATQWAGPQLVHENNVYKLSNNSITNFTLSANELSTTSNFWTNTSASNPVNWDYNPAPGSVLLEFGQAVGQTVDHIGNAISGLPEAGILEKVNTVAPLTISAVQSSSIACFGGTTTVVVSASGGVTPYSGTGSFTVSAGTHTYTVTDAQGTSRTTNLIVTQPSQLSISLSAGTIAINGGTTSITAMVSGGSGNKTYQLNNGSYQSGAVFSGVRAGTHTVTVKDSLNCTRSATITITQPLVLSVVAQAGSIACFGGTTTVNVSATGGVAPYTGTGNFIASAGTRSFTVTDANGATGTATVTINDPTPLVTSASSGTIAITGGSTTITVSVSGGSAPYSYQLNNGSVQSGNIFTGVIAGTYTITVRDNAGCLSETTLSISQPASLLNCTAVPGTILCFGGTTQVTVTATGGTAPYTGTGSFTASAGTHTYTVTDVNGISKNTTITISQPTQLTVSATADSILTFGGTTSIAAMANGGTSPYSYKLNNGAFQTGSTFSNVPAGVYTITARDGSGCTANTTLSVVQPPVNPIVVTLTAGTISCFGSSTTVTVTASGGVPPYSGTGTFTTTAGTRSFSVIDAMGVRQTATIIITQPSSMNIAIMVDTIRSAGGTVPATIQVSGGTPAYQYSLDGGAFQTSNYFRSLGAGTHNITVKDANLCTQIQPFTVYVADAPGVQVSLVSKTDVTCLGGKDGSIVVMGSGGQGPYSYAIDAKPFGVNNKFYRLRAGQYQIQVKDANGMINRMMVSIADGTTACLTARESNEEAYTDISANEIMKIQVYPNPTTSYFELKTNVQNTESLMVQVVDVSGKVIFTAQRQQHYRFGENWKPGVYFIRVINGHETQTHKVIKQ